MYTAHGAHAQPTSFVGEPSAAPSTTPKSPALFNQHLANAEPRATRLTPTSAPSPNFMSAPIVGPPSEDFIDGMNDLHLSGSEPRIYPGMISRQRANSLRQGSVHESDGTAGKKGVPGSIDEAEEAAETKQ